MQDSRGCCLSPPVRDESLLPAGQTLSGPLEVLAQPRWGKQ